MSLYKQLARVSQQQVGRLTVQNIASTVWSFATAGHLEVSLFRVLARAAELCITDVNAQDLANTAWSFASAG